MKTLADETVTKQKRLILGGECGGLSDFGWVVVPRQWFKTTIREEPNGA